MKEEVNVNKKGSGSVLVPFLAGGLVGAGIMLLFAPQSGKEIRRDLNNAVINTRDRIVTAVDKGKALYDGGKSAVTQAIEAGKTAYLREKTRHEEAA